MASKEEGSQSLGPSLILGLIGAVFVLLLLGAGIWGVSKIVSRIREDREDTQEETVAEEESSEEGEEEAGDGEGTEEEGEGEESDGEESEETEDGDTGETEEESGEEGDIDGDGVSDDATEDGEAAEDAEETASDVTEAVMGVWTANDYQEGDITGDSYEVVWGDTLWEIAEARYGSGYDWLKIKDANADQVGFLPNGSQALIFPGQLLELPK